MSTDRRTRGPRVGGRQPKSGARALARHLAAGSLDRRTGIARDFYALQGALVADRGGEETVSTAERILIELAAAELLIVRSIFAYAARQPSLIVETDEGPRLIGPLAKGYTSHAGTLTRTLAALGLECRAKDTQTLEAYLASRRPPAATPAADADAAATPVSVSAPLAAEDQPE